MKTYTITYGWNPPQYDKWRGTYRIFYNVEEKIEKREIKNPETDEVTVETYTYWLCDIVELDKDDKIVRMLRENPNSIECQRAILLLKINAYDSSKKVNNFSINGYNTWLDKATRVGLKLRFEAEERAGHTQTILWQNGVNFTLPITTALQMLDLLELYASSCYDMTQLHISTANTLSDITEIKEYNYRNGYPDKVEL